ncbi:hypothetical protein [Labrys neptuniae]
MKLFRRRWRQARWIARESGAGARSFARGFLNGFRNGFGAAQRGEGDAFKQRNREEWDQFKSALGSMMQEAGETLRNIDEDPCRFLLVERGFPALLFDTGLYLDEKYAASRPAPELAASAVMTSARGDFGLEFRQVPRDDSRARFDVFVPPVGFGSLGGPGAPTELVPAAVASIERRCVYRMSLASSR